MLLSTWLRWNVGSASSGIGGPLLDLGERDPGELLVDTAEDGDAAAVGAHVVLAL
jgi:hypothetical protein